MPALTDVYKVEHTLYSFDNEHIVPSDGFCEGHNCYDNSYDRYNMPATDTDSVWGGGKRGSTRKGWGQ